MDFGELAIMSISRIAFGCDHAGVALKNALIDAARQRSIDVEDFGTNQDESVDYPDFAQAVARAVSDGEADRGVLVCGSGIGMSIAANRFTGIRAALCCDTEMAALCRQHNDANILVLGARLTDAGVAKECFDAFLDTEFEGGRHARRVGKMG